MGQISNTPEVFWSRVEIGTSNECWPYTGRQRKPTRAFPVGHGIYDHDGTWDYAHRYAWYLTYGSWPEPHCLHECDNPPCVNPNHLYQGTHQDNVRDRELRHRRAAPKGLASTNAKLTKDQVEHIRSVYVRYQKGPNSAPALARLYGVDITTIIKAAKGERYRDVCSNAG